jgi:capsular polysaccharide biosynthesis protein
VCNQLAEQAPKCFQDEYGKGNGKVTIITSAAAPSSPISPNVNQNTLYGLAIGAVLGILLAFFLEIIDTTLKPGDDLAKLYGVPVFAEIVDFEKEG